MVIKTILPATESEIAEANQVLSTKQRSQERRDIPNDVRKVLDILDIAKGVTITFDGEHQGRQAERTSAQIRGHMTNPEFRHKGITLTVIDEQNEPKLVVKKRVEG